MVGVHCLAMMEIIKNNGDSMTLEHNLKEVNPEIELVQETSRIDEEGQWLIICSKTNAPRIIWFIYYTLPVIFQEHIDEMAKITGHEHPDQPATG
eukprot:12738178-Ditylum_brightwellii.AAC.1